MVASSPRSSGRDISSTLTPLFLRIAAHFAIAATVPGPARCQLGVLIKATEALPKSKSVESASSLIANTSASNCKSSTQRAKKPSVSKVGENTVVPAGEMALYVGLNAKMPV